MNKKLLLALATLPVLSGCGTTLRVEAPRPPVVIVDEPAPVRSPQVRIPPGHLPPPGKCRVWYPERPPGHQPPPGDCGELRYRVPNGAVLVRG
jgi:hypothetical protein